MIKRIIVLKEKVIEMEVITQTVTYERRYTLHHIFLINTFPGLATAVSLHRLRRRPAFQSIEEHPRTSSPSPLQVLETAQLALHRYFFPPTVSHASSLVLKYSSRQCRVDIQLCTLVYEQCLM